MGELTRLGVTPAIALPVALPKGPVLLVAVVFGIAVFMQPGAGTNFVRHNLPPQAWGSAVSLMTLIFAVTQIAGKRGLKALLTIRSAAVQAPC